jgi:hypothetical protein
MELHDQAPTPHETVAVTDAGVLSLARNPFGGVVVCDDRDLLIEEFPDAYKNIVHVIADLTECGLARVVATFRALITFKKRDELAPNAPNVTGRGGDDPAACHQRAWPNGMPDRAG